MNTEAALLSAIFAQPDEDTPRLVFADWEEENGDPARGKEIRASVEAARLPEGSLLRNIVEPTPLEKYSVLYEHILIPRRGFYDIASFLRVDWLPNAQGKYAHIERFKALKKEHPLTGMRLNDSVGFNRYQLERMLEHSTTRGIWSHLHSFGVRLEPGAIHVLASAMDRFKHLATLDLSAPHSAPLHTQGARAIGRRAHQFRRLRCLNVAGNDIGDEGVSELLAQAHEFRHLNSLDLSRNTITAKGADYLAERIGEMPKLRVVSLAKNPIRNAGVQALMDHSKQLQHLESLDLSECEFGVDGAVAIAAHLHELKGLKALNLAGNKLGSEGVRALSQDAVNLGGLHYLDLSRTGMDSLAAKSLARHGFEFRSLVMLKLDDNFNGSELAEAEFPQLIHLYADHRAAGNVCTELRLRRAMEAADPSLPVAMPSLRFINDCPIPDELIPPLRPAAQKENTTAPAAGPTPPDNEANVGMLLPNAVAPTLPLK